MRRLRERPAKDPLAALTNRQIGDRLFLAEKTVKNHVFGVFGRLGLSRRTQAATFITKLKGE